MGLYDNLTFNQGTYIPQYAGTPVVGSPLDEIKQVADTLQGRHYTNLAQANNLQILANQVKSRLLPGAKTGVDKHIEQLDLALQEMAKSGGENSTARIAAIANAFQSDQGLLNAQQRTEEYNKQTELINQLTAKGEIPLFNKTRRAELENASMDSDLFKTPYQSTVEPYRDPNPEMQSIWDVVKPDSYESELRTAINSKTGKPIVEALGREDLGLFYETLTTQGVTGKKIKDQLENAWTNYKNTASFKQQTGELVGKTEAQVKKEFLAKGLLNVFNNLKRDYRNLPKESSSDSGSNDHPLSTAIPTTAPAKVIENSIPYNDDGKDKIVDVKFRGNEFGILGDFTKEEAKRRKDAEAVNFHPQYLKDLNVASEVFGAKDVKPGTEEAKKLVQNYNDIRKRRVNNAWTVTLSKEQALEVSDKLQREWALRQYMDQDGNVINPIGKNGEITDEFKELTGGDPFKFEVESVYDAKNHFGVNENFAQPIGIVSKDKDGNPTRFLASQLPGMFSTPPEAINTNVIYSKTNINPGQEIDLGSGIKATALIGSQFDKEGVAELKNQDYVLKAFIPGYNNNEPIYTTPEFLAGILARQKGIKLNIK